MSVAMVSADTKGIVRRQWLASVDEIADIALQRRTWLDPNNANPHWSYLEFVCSYPDGEQLRSGRDRHFLSAEEFEAFDKLRVALDAYTAPNGDNYDHGVILADPGWHEVVATALDVKRCLLLLLRDPVKRRCLNE